MDKASWCDAFVPPMVVICRDAGGECHKIAMKNREMPCKMAMKHRENDGTMQF
jgi:hypothetical protein